nr:E3 SUMO-protein ligase KIAA1586-like [Hydra vulgaris]
MDKWLANGRKRKLSSDSSKSNLENDSKINREVTDFSSIETCQFFPQCDEMFSSKMQINQHETTYHIFRTVYHIAKMNRPFSDLKELILLQVENGLDMGLILQSDHACANIVYHISNEMRPKLVKYIIHNDNKVGFMIEESTTMSKKSALSICLRVNILEINIVNSIIFDFVELSNTEASSIANSFICVLHDFGFNNNFLLLNWVSFACDGASNMLGKKEGLAKLLLNQFPNLILWHCNNHRLELAVNVVVRDILSICTRWVSSSARSVMAVWNNYAALYQHFHKSSLDSRRSAGDRAQYAGLKNKLCDINFILNMALMLDALIELEHLSKKLQHRQSSLPDGHWLITLKYHIFQSMRNNSGEYYSQTQLAAEKFEFKGVKLQIGKPQWFADQDPCFGDNDIRQLAKTLNICEITAVQGFREYISTGDCNKTPNDFQPLRTAINTLIVSTAECEHSFSTMNIILSSLRNSLLIKTVSSLMFISLVGPPITHFDPKDYVIKWFGKGHRDGNFRNCEAPALKSINESETYSKIF